MADYTPYIPTVGSIDYPAQLSTFITLSEAIDTEIETARNGSATLLEHINLKFDKTGGTLTGNLTIEDTSPTMWFIESGVTTDNSKWSFLINNETFNLRTVNDALNITNNVYSVDRTGAVVDAFNINTLCNTEYESPAIDLTNTALGLDTNEANTRITENSGQFLIEFLSDNKALSSTVLLIDKTGYNANTIDLYPATDSGVRIRGNVVWNAGNDGTGSGLDADTVDGIEAVALAQLSGTNSFSGVNTFTAIPIFNGGTSGASAPFTVDSNFLVTNLNADQLDGQEGAYYAPLASPTFTGTPSLPTGATAVTQTAGDDSTALATTAYVESAVPPLPEGYLYGLTLSNNITDSDHDIDISTGGTRNDGNSTNLIVSSVITKQIDIAWAIGTNAGGMFTGTVAGDTWYHMFLIQKDSDGTIDAGFDTSVTAANIPSGYTAYKRIGSVLTNASVNIIAFIQKDGWFEWITPIQDIGDNATGTTAVNATISAPLGIVSKVDLNVHLQDGSASTHAYISSLDQVDSIPVAGGPFTNLGITAGGATSVNISSNISLNTNTASQIRYRTTIDSTIDITVARYFDYRGQG